MLKIRIYANFVGFETLEYRSEWPLHFESARFRPGEEAERRHLDAHVWLRRDEILQSTWSYSRIAVFGER